MVELFLPDGSDVGQTLLSKGLVQKSPTLRDEDQSSQFHPRKRGPRKAKPFISKRSIAETRSVVEASCENLVKNEIYIIICNFSVRTMLCTQYSI